MRCYLILLLLLVATGVACDGHTTVSGRVIDPGGVPILGADIKPIYKPDDPRYRRASTTITEKDGRFAVGLVHSPSNKLPIRLEANKEGFTEYAENLPSMIGYEKEILLRPLK